jgi:hypothetical protein
MIDDELGDGGAFMWKGWGGSLPAKIIKRKDIL